MALREGISVSENLVPHVSKWYLLSQHLPSSLATLCSNGPWHVPNAQGRAFYPSKASALWCRPGFQSQLCNGLCGLGHVFYFPILSKRSRGWMVSRACPSQTSVITLWHAPFPPASPPLDGKGGLRAQVSLSFLCFDSQSVMRSPLVQLSYEHSPFSSTHESLKPIHYHQRVLFSPAQSTFRKKVILSLSEHNGKLT